MNKISDQSIINLLKRDLQEVKMYYDQSRILGIYVFGLANYGFARELSDIKTQAFYLPSFEDMCLNKKVDKEICYNSPQTNEQARHISVKDFRMIPTLAFQYNHAAQALFTKFYIVNPRYEETYYNYLKNNSEKIVKFNKSTKIADAALKGLGYADSFIQYYKQGQTKEIDSNLLIGLVRLANYCEKMFQDKPYIECISPTTAKQIGLWERVLRGATLESDIHLIEDMKNTFYAMHKVSCKYESQTPEYINTALIQIMKIATINHSDIANFLKKITDTEKIALIYIIDNCGYEGNFVISQIINQTGISRPVFNSLIQKIKEFNIAEVKNQGVKGTYLKILHPESLKAYL